MEVLLPISLEKDLRIGSSLKHYCVSKVTGSVTNIAITSNRLLSSNVHEQIQGFDSFIQLHDHVVCRTPAPCA